MNFRNTLLALPLLGMIAGCTVDVTDGYDVEPSEDVDTAAQELAFYQYGGENTNSAQDVVNTAKPSVSIAFKETVMIGTTEIKGGSFVGNTFLRLKATNNNSFLPPFNDNYCGSAGSLLAYTNPDASISSFNVWAGCALNTPCGTNKLAISRMKQNFSYYAENTNSAQTNTWVSEPQYLNGGQTIRVSTCKAYAVGAAASGDTYLRLFRIVDGAPSQEVASNDNAPSLGTCGCSTSSLIKYTASMSGYYEVRAGCSANGSCKGDVAVYVE